MEEYAVILFSVEAAQSGRHRRREKWNYQVTTREYPDGRDRLVLVEVVLPGLGTKGKPWKPEEKAAYLSGICLPAEGRRVCYLYEKSAETFLGRKNEPFSMEWCLLLLRRFAQTSLGTAGNENSLPFAPEVLLLVPDRFLNPEEWVWLFAQQTRYIGILTENPEVWEGLQEEVYEEYGFLPEVESEPDKLHLPDGSHSLLIVSGAAGGGIKPARIPHCGVWLSTVTGETEAKRIGSRLRHIRYLDGEVLWGL